MLCASLSPYTVPAALHPAEPQVVSSVLSFELAVHPQHLTQPWQTSQNIYWLQLKYLHFIRMKNSLGMQNCRRSSLSNPVCHVCVAVPWLAFGFVITDLMHFPLPFSLSPERATPGHLYLVATFPFLSFPLLLLLSRTRWVGFSSNSIISFFVSYCRSDLKDRLGLDM